MLPAEFLALNTTTADYPRDKTIAELFAEQVQKSPDACALVAGFARLTYSELNARSDELALRLQNLGVMPDDVVGVADREKQAAAAALAGAR